MISDERYKELMEQVGMPHNNSLLIAFRQLENEVTQSFKAEKDKTNVTIVRLRGQLQNCVNHLDRVKRKVYGLNIDDCIESANKAIYETHRK